MNKYLRVNKMNPEADLGLPRLTKKVVFNMALRENCF